MRENLKETGSLWTIWTGAPYRVLFLCGCIQFVVSMVFWLYELVALHTAIAPWQGVIAPAEAHGFLMLYGLFVFFIFGFLMTAMPRWLNAAPVARSHYLATAGLLTAGVIAFYIGYFSSHALLIVAVACLLGGWLWGFAVCLSLVHRSRRLPGWRIYPVVACVGGGLLGAAAYFFWLLSNWAPAFEFALNAGLWLYLVPLVTVVSFRLIGYFSANVLGAQLTPSMPWVLPVILACLLTHLVLTLGGFSRFLFLVDIPAALLVVRQVAAWRMARAITVPLLGMLHISFCWLAIGLGLYSLESWLAFAGTAQTLGRAPLHALSIGFISSMVVAMASRVSLGHSGRQRVAGGLVIWTFVFVQLTAVIRVAADIPVIASGPVTLLLLVAAAFLWLVAAVPWALWLGAIYLTPRVDG